jgi:hypothetical protein
MVKINEIVSELSNEKFKELNYQIKGKDLFMAKTTGDVTVHKLGNLDLKGLIFDEQLNLVAPGCIVPQETHDDSRTDIKGYATAIDGVQYRIYFHDNEWKCSTSGRIIPNVFWGAKGTPTFEELFFDASDQWDNTALNKGYCYYVFLEHPKFTNIVKHSEIKLTLVDIIDMTSLELNHISLDKDNGFTNHLELVNSVPVLASESDPRPLTNNDTGYCIYYDNNDIYRQETSLYQQAVSVKPNMSDPAQHWVHLTKEGTIDVYLGFFPWHEEFFNGIEEKYNTLLRTIMENYDSIRDVGWKGTEIPSRHVNYMRELVRDLNQLFRRNPTHSYDLIEDHLLDQDTKRLHFLINPYEIPPKIREQVQVQSEEQSTPSTNNLDDIMMMD